MACAAKAREQSGSEENKARAEKIDHLARLMYMHLQQLPPKERQERMRAIERIAEEVRSTAAL